MAAVLLLADLYKRPVHVCHVARRAEVRGGGEKGGEGGRDGGREGGRRETEGWMDKKLILLCRLLSSKQLKKEDYQSHVKLVHIVSRAV